MGSAKAIVGQFLELTENNKDKQALELYLKEQGSFFAAFERATDNFEFHSNIVIPLLFKYKDSAFAYKESIRILEAQQLLTEAVILINNEISTHYGRLVYELEKLYIEAGYYDYALVQTDKILNITNDKGYHATAYINKAYIYILMDKKTSALKSAEKAVSILKKYKLEDEHNILADCQKIIEATKSNHTSKMASLKEIMQNQFRLRHTNI